jgi:glycosyltransferase involved in cell wall biosynthesis
MAMTSQPAVSVVVPTCRRPHLLAHCLDALAKQSLQPSAFEVIVVDDGRSADTRAAVGRIAVQWRSAGGPRLRLLVPHGTRGPAGARNCGWRSADAAIIAFTEDDTVPDRDWLREGLQAIAAPRRVAVWGRVEAPSQDRLAGRARHEAGTDEATFVAANCFVRRAALERVGGFDERYVRAWCEDTDLYCALLAAHPAPDSIAAAPAARVVNPARPMPFADCLRRQSDLAFDALLFKKHPAKYDQIVGTRHAPSIYYAIVGVTLAALLAWPWSVPLARDLGGFAVGLILALAILRPRGVRKTPRVVAEVVLTSFPIPYLALYWRLVGALRWRVAFY